MDTLSFIDKEWLEENKEKLLENYEFDINELSRHNDKGLEGLNGFDEYCLNGYISHLEDKIYDMERHGYNLLEQNQLKRRKV